MTTRMRTMISSWSCRVRRDPAGLAAFVYHLRKGPASS
jgi:hypothetical protein